MDDKGETRRERNARFGVETVEPEPVDPDFEYLVEWFWDLSAGRPQGLNGPNPLSMTEIANWSVLTGTIIRREEIAIIRALDAAYLSAIAKEQAENAERAKPKKD